MALSSLRGTSRAGTCPRARASASCSGAGRRGRAQARPLEGRAGPSKDRAVGCRSGTKDPIAGPHLVAAARAAARSVLPEQEEDGWAGEPSAWAESDSFTQKLSAFTQNNLSGFKQFVAEQVAGEFDADAVDAAIESEVSRGGVLMYSFTSCPFCKKAKELLDDKGALYTVVELDEIADGAARRARLGARTGRTSGARDFLSTAPILVV